MNDTDLLKFLVTRETELERKRVTKLARNMWGDVIDLEARIDECRLWRKRLSKEANEASKSRDSNPFMASDEQGI